MQRAIYILIVVAGAFGAGTADLRSQPAGEYAGSETCAICHDELHARFLKSRHALVETSARFKHVGQSCESCHGPGQAHAENEGDVALIFSFKKSPRRDQEATCLRCHGMQSTHAGLESSLHQRGGGPSCNECHQVHGPEAAVPLLRRASVDTCVSCHAERVADFRRPFHHRVLEGGMACTDCHQPHGGSLPRQLKSAGADPAPCARCHTDKAGPFVFEHAPGRFGGCLSCHVPHGSNNPKMLVRNNVQSLCLECHSLSAGIPGSQPPSFHDLRTARFQSCTTCHVKIHGSHSNRFFIR